MNPYTVTFVGDFFTMTTSVELDPDEPDIAVIPVQDVLGLGSEARMNAPGRPQGNWTWRLPPGALREEHADRLAEMAWLYDRDPAA